MDKKEILCRPQTSLIVQVSFYRSIKYISKLKENKHTSFFLPQQILQVWTSTTHKSLANIWGVAEFLFGSNCI